MGAAVVGRQGVHLCNAAHAGHKAGTYAATAAHQIAISQGTLHQPLGNVVQGSKAVADNRIELLFQPLGDNFRQRIPVPFLGRAPGHVLNIVCRIGPEGLERILSLGMLGEQTQLLHLVGNLSGVVNDHFVSFFFTQVAELFQHFVGGLKVQGRLIVTVVKALTGLNNRPVNGVVGIEEMHVSGGHHRQTQLFT